MSGISGTIVSPSPIVPKAAPLEIDCLETKINKLVTDIVKDHLTSEEIIQINLEGLSNEIAYRIMLRFPVRSLIRCASMSEKWKVMIFSPRFVHEHFAHDSKQPDLLVCSTGVNGMHAFSLFMDKMLNSCNEPDGFTLPGKFDYLYGPCNGVILVTISTSNKLALWNPATMKLRLLSSPQDYNNEVDQIGFMIDLISSEFKVVVIHGYSLNEGESHHCALYKSSENSWRYFEDEAVYNSIVESSRCRSTQLHGWCYWMKYSRKFNPKHYKLLAFDFINEAFHELEIPGAAQSGQDIDLATYRESIALHSYQATNNCLDIWWSEERGQWTLVHRLNMSHFLIKSPLPLGFWGEKFILARREDLILIQYDIKSQAKTEFRIGKKEGDVCAEIYIFEYKESLVSLKDEAHGIMELDTQCAESRDFFSTKESLVSLKDKAREIMELDTQCDELRKFYSTERIHLTDDHVYCIMLRLPVCTLSRFIILCHKWEATIASKHFVTEHFLNECNQIHLLVCWNASLLLRGGHAFSMFKDKSLQSYEEPAGFTLAGNFSWLYGPSYGVFLLTISTSNKLALWNPATRRLRPLPSPQDFDSEEDMLGFMVDPTSLLFKIVLIHGYSLSGSESRHCGVYTSCNNSWKYVEDQALRHSFVERGTCGITPLDGLFYWKMCARKTRKFSILAFDMRSEDFHEIEIPVIAQSREEVEVEVATYKGMLALLNFHCEGIEIWLRDEVNLWARRFKLDVYPKRFMAALGFWEGNLLYTLVTKDKGLKVVLHDLNSHARRVVGIAQGDVKSSYLATISIFHYKESLLSLKDEARGIKGLNIQSAEARDFFS